MIFNIAALYIDPRGQSVLRPAAPPHTTRLRPLVVRARGAGMVIKPARVLLADPPWRFNDRMPGNRGAERKYKCMTVAELAEYQLPPLAPDCLMLMWRCAAMQQEALAVVKHWGFTVKSEIVWNKLTKHGKLWFGQGHYVRG